MHQAHSNHQPGLTLGRFFCGITLLTMLVAALLPTIGASAQGLETQTPTAQLTPAGTTVVLTSTLPAPAETQTAAPAATPEPASPTPASTSTSPVLPTATEVPSPTPASTLPASTLPPSSAESLSSQACLPGEKTATLHLDGISLSVCAPVLPGEFIVPDPASSDQIATAATLKPYQEFSIAAIPFGMQLGTETLPIAATGLAAQYLQDLKDARAAQGGQVKDGPVVSLFGSPASGIASLVSLRIHGDTPSNVVIVEWVAEAGKRLWIIRYSQEIPAGANSLDDVTINRLIQSLANVAISSPDIAGPSTSAAYFARPHTPPPSGPITPQAAGDLPFPSWWNGDCDVNNFHGSYALGGIYRGVKACGPINTERAVQFAPGLWGELEWQCVELSMRFMYLAYGVVPYHGNGKDVVWNYTPKSTDRVSLVKIANDTVGKPPQAGDVLSYGTTSTYGHTSVVTGSNVDSSGNGTVTIIQQNVSIPANGIQTLTVTNWHVKSGMIVTGWLHGNNPVPAVSSISPTSIMAGAKGLAILAYGTNFVSSSEVRWNGLSLVTAFVSGTELIAAVPDSYITTGGTANVTVYSPGPGGGSSSAKTFTITNAVPVLTGLSPTTALIAGSSFTLSVTGTDFIKTSKVMWNGTALSTTFVSAVQLSAVVPAADLAAAGAVNITVFNPTPGGGTSGAQVFTVNYRVPTLKSISPITALANSGNLTLTVNGTYFSPGAIVRWNGADLATTYISTIKLTAVILAADFPQAATIPITVFNPSPGGGTSASLNFNINNPVPGITSLALDHITAGTGAFSLTVNGKNFVPTSKVRWNGTDLATTFVSPTQVTGQVSAAQAANPGWMSITIFNPLPMGGTTSALIFKVISQTPGVCVQARTIALGASDSYNNGGAGSTNNIDTYSLVVWDMHGPEFTYLFNSAQTATVVLNIRDNTVNLKAFMIDGASGSCSAANGMAYGTKIVFNALANHNYYFVVDGYQGAVGSYRLTVDAFTPTDGSQLLTARPVFQWPVVVGAASYKLQVSTTTNFASLILNTSTTKTSYAVGAALPANQQLYWRVQTNTGSYVYMPKGYLGFKTGNPPSLPALSSPAANGLLTGYTPLLNWSDSTLPAGVSLSHYQVQVALDSAFTSLVIDQSTSQSAYQVSSPALTPNTKYYWRFQALGSNGHTSNWSGVYSFREAMLPTSLTSPANSSSPAVMTFRPTFSWNPVIGASSYTIQISTVNTFSTTLVNASTSAVAYVPGIDLPINKVLYWRVRAGGVNGPSLWTAVWSFTSASPPSTPVLSTPYNNSLLTSYTPTLYWKASTLPVGVTLANYRVQVSVDAAFTSPWIDQTVTQTNYPLTLSPNTKYFWRVRANGSNGHSSNWSSVYSCRAAMLPTSLLLPASGTTVTKRQPAFDWSDVSGATSYTIQVSTSSTFTTLIPQTTPVSSAYTAAAALPAATKLYWRVRANGPNGPSLWSVTFTFHTP